MNDNTRLLLLALLLFILVVAALLLLKGGDGTQTASPVVSTEAALSDRLRFPDGYHLVDAYAYAFQYTGPEVVYICQSDSDPTDYRICTPAVTRQEN